MEWIVTVSNSITVPQEIVFARSPPGWSSGVGAPTGVDTELFVIGVGK